MSSTKVMTLRHAGTCQCGRALAAGERAGWDSLVRRVVCLACLEPLDELRVDEQRPAETGTAGSSLEREYERRKTKREARIVARLPRTGKFLAKVFPEPNSTTAFKAGAEGERAAAERLVRGSGDHVEFLFNRSLGVGRRDGDIDVIAVHGDGVTIFDVKHYKDAKVEVRSVGNLWSGFTSRLFVGGRDRTSFLSSLERQSAAVRIALDLDSEFKEIEVGVALCFVGADLPLFGKLKIDGVPILGSKQVARQLKSISGPVDSECRSAIHKRLALRLPPA
jgi:hypothetical protein